MGILATTPHSGVSFDKEEMGEEDKEGSSSQQDSSSEEDASSKEDDGDEGDDGDKSKTAEEEKASNSSADRADAADAADAADIKPFDREDSSSQVESVVESVAEETSQNETTLRQSTSSNQQSKGRLCKPQQGRYPPLEILGHVKKPSAAPLSKKQQQVVSA